jgi:transposase
MFYGLDVHKAFVQVCALSDDGKRRRDYQVGGSAEALEAFGKRLKRSDAVVLEATFHSWAIVEILRRHCERVVVAEPAQLKAIASARIKTDKVDAHILAQLLRLDFLPEVQLPDRDTWAVRQLMAHRRQLRRQSVATKNTIRGVLNRSLLTYPGKFLYSKGGYRWLAEVAVPAAERRVLDDQVALLQAVKARLDSLDAELWSLARKDPRASLLVTIPGVDVVVAMGFLAAIGDVSRFETAQKLTSYFGLVPRVYQSSTTTYYGHITKAGSRNARWLAIEAAYSIARGGTPLSAVYLRIRRRKGHQIAITALARKLIVIVWHLLTTGHPYRYAAPLRTREKLRGLRGDRPIHRGAIELEDIYAEAGLTVVAPAAAETRVAKRNRATVTRLRAEFAWD